MSLKIASALFAGPYEPDKTKVRVNQAACVYVVISREGKPYNPTFRVIDVADSSRAAIDFATHPGRTYWDAEAAGEVGIYLFRPDASEPEASAIREQLVAAIRERYRPPLGLVPIDGMT